MAWAELDEAPDDLAPLTDGLSDAACNDGSWCVTTAATGTVGIDVDHGTVGGAREAHVCVALPVAVEGLREPVVVLDASHLVHIDTSGLDALRQVHKIVLMRGGTLHLENLPEQPRDVIERAGFAAELAQNRASEEVAV